MRCSQRPASAGFTTRSACAAQACVPSAVRNSCSDEDHEHAATRVEGQAQHALREGLGLAGLGRGPGGDRHLVDALLEQARPLLDVVHRVHVELEALEGLLQARGGGAGQGDERVVRAGLRALAARHRRRAGRGRRLVGGRRRRGRRAGSGRGLGAVAGGSASGAAGESAARPGRVITVWHFGQRTLNGRSGTFVSSIWMRVEHWEHWACTFLPLDQVVHVGVAARGRASRPGAPRGAAGREGRGRGRSPSGARPPAA